MIVNADVKGLEVAVAAWLSQDKVLIDELVNKVDIHSVNQQRFGLPSRLIAKTLKFRILYGGSGYAFARDPAFRDVSSKHKFWDAIIEEYYAKYSGIKKWHNQLVYEASTTGRVVCPTGRFFKFASREGNWPVTQIKNYPVQGTGADLVSLSRIEFFRLIKERKIDCSPVATVHDSIVVDCPVSSVPACAKALSEAVERIPALYTMRFGGMLNVPITAEVSVGPNLGDLEDYAIEHYDR